MNQQVTVLPNHAEIGRLKVVSLEVSDDGVVAVTNVEERLSIDLPSLANLSVSLGGEAVEPSNSESLKSTLQLISDHNGDQEDRFATLLFGEVARRDWVPADFDQSLGAGKEFGSIVGGIGKSIAGKVGGFILDAVFNVFMPKEEDILSKIKSLVRGLERFIEVKLAEQKVIDAHSAIKATQRRIKYEYIPMKKKYFSNKEKMMNILRDEHKTLGRVLSRLEESDVQIDGFPVYIIGVPIHLSIIQEMILIDPSVWKSKNSSYVETLKNYKDDYAQMGHDMWDKFRGNAVHSFYCHDIKTGHIGNLYVGETHLKRRTATAKIVVKKFIGHKNFDPQAECHKQFQKNMVEIPKELSIKLTDDEDFEVMLNNWRNADHIIS